MLMRLLFAAVIAGLAAGAVASVIQLTTITPLILKAEVYETGGHDHGAAAGHEHAGAAGHEHAGAHEHATAEHAEAHDHGAGAWAPADGAERTLYTILAGLVVGVGYALMLCGAMTLTGSSVTWRTGLMWGAAGFICFTLAPAFGLSPELPGMPAADLLARQTWWVGTAAATAAGLALLAFAPNPWLKLLAPVLFVVPHLIGAPEPASHASDVPAALAATFAAHSIVAGAILWVIIGALGGYLLGAEPGRRAADDLTARA